MAPKADQLADHTHGRKPIADASRRQNEEFGASLLSSARGRIATPESALGATSGPKNLLTIGNYRRSPPVRV
jgi:hypothetical protein